MFKVTFVIWIGSFVLLALSIVSFKWFPRVSHWGFVGFVSGNIIVFILTLMGIFLYFLDLAGFYD